MPKLSFMKTVYIHTQPKRRMHCIVYSKSVCFSRKKAITLKPLHRLIIACVGSLQSCKCKGCLQTSV